MPHPSVEPEEMWQDLRPVLDQELNRLPDKYRLPVVLCDLEGRTRKQVARQLGLPDGTLSNRLAAARRLLARRLTRRGLTLSGGAVAAVLAHHGASACPPAALVVSTTKAALGVAAGDAATVAVSAKVAALAAGVLKTMLLSKLKVASAALLLGIVVVGTGAGVLWSRPMAGAPFLVAQREEAKGAPKERVDSPPPAPEGGTRQGQPVEASKKDAKDMEEAGDTILIAALLSESTASDDFARGLSRSKGERDDRLEEMRRLFSTLAFTKKEKLASAQQELRELVLRAFRRMKALDPQPEGLDVLEQSIYRRDKRLQPMQRESLQKLLVQFVEEERQRTLEPAATSEPGKDEQPQEPTVIKAEDKVRAMLWHPGGKLIFTLTAPGQDTDSIDRTELKVWDVKSGAVKQTLLEKSRVFHTAVSPSGKTLVTAGFKKEGIKVWDISDLTKAPVLLRTLSEELEPTSLALSGDGKILAVGTRDGATHLWDAETGAARTKLEGHVDDVRAVSFSPDKKLLATAGTDKTVKVWEVETGTLKKALSGHDDRVTAVAFSPTSKLAASGGYDRTVRLWDVESGEQKKAFKEALNPSVRAVAFSPDGKTLASCGIRDEGISEVKLWDIETGKLRHSLSGHSGGATSLAFTSDGKQLAVGGGRTVSVWVVN